MRLLFLTTMLPAGMRNGGELWSQTIVNALAGAGAGAQVTVLGYGDCRAPGEISAGHHQVETRGAPLFAALAAIRAVGRTAFTVQKWKSAVYRRALEGLLGERWDAAVIDHAQMGWVQPLLEARSIPFFYLAHHAEHQLYATLAAAARLPMRAVYRREARCLAAVERRLLHGAVESWCISERDVALLRTCADGPVRSLPALGAAALADPEAPSSGPDLALLGNWRWAPNRHALDWFLREVGPKLPAAWVVHVGGAADADLVDRYPGAVFLGPVPDAGAFLRAARRIAVPSFAAQGLNLKLIDAIASGRPVVASAAALALAGEVPPDIAGAESAEAFAAALIDVERVDREARRRWLEARQAELGAAVADALARLGGPRKRTGDGAGAP